MFSIPCALHSCSPSIFIMADASPAVSAAEAPAAAAAAPAASSSLVQFDQHVSHPPITAEVRTAIDALRAAVQQEKVYTDNSVDAAHFLTDQNLHRYLRARQFDQVKAKKLLLESLTWRLAYHPERITAAEVEHECATGKIRVLQQLDVHGRPIIVMDSSRENNQGKHDSNIRHLVWQLERAERKMNGEDRPAGEAAPAPPAAAAEGQVVEKYCLFINMERNSIWNSPPMKTSTETLKTLTDRYPEHLGTAIVYKPGMLFAGLWAVCKPLMDPKTVAKVKFIRGDVKEGSDNDKMLREIIGPDWKALCDVPKDDYDHKSFWPQVLADEAHWNARHGPPAAEQPAAAPLAEVEAAPAPVEAAPAVVAEAAAPAAEAVAAEAPVAVAPAAAAEPAAAVAPAAEAPAAEAAAGDASAVAAPAPAAAAAAAVDVPAAEAPVAEAVAAEALPVAVASS
jgi:hypothetical protein